MWTEYETAAHTYFQAIKHKEDSAAENLTCTQLSPSVVPSAVDEASTTERVVTQMNDMELVGVTSAPLEPAQKKQKTLTNFFASSKTTTAEVAAVPTAMTNSRGYRQALRV